MALKLLESFDDGAWDHRLSGTITASEVGSSYGKNGNGARVGTTPGWVWFGFGIANPSVIGFDFKIADSSSTVTGHMLTYQTGVTVVSSLGYDPVAGRLRFSILGTYGYSDTGSIALGDWHHVEMYLHEISPTGAYMNWSLDGGPLTGITGASAGGYTSTAVKFGGGSSPVWDYYIDNVYYCDTTGGVNDNLLGPIRVDDLLPNGVGNYSNMTPYGGATNYELVDENPPNDDTDYVYSTTEGDKDTYQMNATTDPSEAITGVVANIVSRKTDAGAKFLRPMARIGGADYTGDSGALTETYGLVSHIWDESPATATTWASTEIDGMEVGQEVRDS